MTKAKQDKSRVEDTTAYINISYRMPDFMIETLLVATSLHRRQG